MVRQARELERKVAERTAQLASANAEVTQAHDRLQERNSELQEMQAELEAQNTELQETQQTLAEANERLQALATTDGLTGLINHRSFQERLETEWARHQRENTPLSLILIDVDNFKSYNDTYGHPAGDDVLRSVAQVLKDIARVTDVTARYGGEEFVVIAPDTDAEGVDSLGERLRAAVECAEWPLRSITGSFGVATSGGSSAPIDSPAALIAAADAALYRSKRSGKNRVTASVADPSDAVRSAA
jgi:diguanylate cyclase (GGDEF)-like protein